MNTSRRFSILARVAAGFVIAAALFVAAPAASADSADTEPVPGTPAGSDTVGWPCAYGYPCLYDLPHGEGVRLERIGCGFHDYRGGEFDNWADSARTYANTVTVFNYNHADGLWENYGTVPAWREWEFERRNVIDGVLVNC